MKSGLSLKHQTGHRSHVSGKRFVRTMQHRNMDDKLQRDMDRLLAQLKRERKRQ